MICCGQIAVAARISSVAGLDHDDADFGVMMRVAPVSLDLVETQPAQQVPASVCYYSFVNSVVLAAVISEQSQTCPLHCPFMIAETCR